MRIDHQVFYTMLPEEMADKLCRALKGCSVTVPRWAVEHKDILDDYRHMRNIGVPRAEAIKKLAVMYDRSPRTVRRVIANAEN